MWSISYISCNYHISLEIREKFKTLVHLQNPVNCSNFRTTEARNAQMIFMRFLILCLIWQPHVDKRRKYLSRTFHFHPCNNKKNIHLFIIDRSSLYNVRRNFITEIFSDRRHVLTGILEHQMTTCYQMEIWRIVNTFRMVLPCLG